MSEETMTRREELATRLERVRATIAEAAAHAGRDAAEIQLLPVTKFHPVSDVALLQELGVTAVGENRDQEAKEKKEALPEMSFHMIGQIQSKKANSIARWADWVHSVDSVAIAEKLDRGMELAIDRGQRQEGAVLHCLVQLSADGDSARGGTRLDQLAEIVDMLEAQPRTRCGGFMCVPPLDADPREVFERGAAVVQRWSEQLRRRLDYSAGMSADMVHAIESGSTFVRVGTDILGPRPVV